VVVSHATPGAAWQHDGLVADYVERRQILLPLLEVQEEVITLALTRHAHAIARFLDLGCGAGAMSRLVLDAAPSSSGVGIDFSEPMLACARERLAGYGGRWQSAAADLGASAWTEAVPHARYDAIVSGLAIHHLPAERKRALFAEAFALLVPGAMLINMDYVAIDGPLQGLFDERMLENAVHAEHEAGGTRSQAELDLEDDDDRPDTVEDQLRWMREAGFGEVEVHFKWAEAAVYGGTKLDGKDK
jgi:tRNA (cmo5U34)-methyltransferase